VPRRFSDLRRRFERTRRSFLRRIGPTLIEDAPVAPAARSFFDFAKQRRLVKSGCLRRAHGLEPRSNLKFGRG